MRFYIFPIAFVFVTGNLTEMSKQSIEHDNEFKQVILKFRTKPLSQKLFQCKVLGIDFRSLMGKIFSHSLHPIHEKNSNLSTLSESLKGSDV